MAFEDSDIYQAILDGDLAALGCSVGAEDVNLQDSSGKSYLHICIELGQMQLVEYLAQKVFLGFRDDNGHTAIDLAARYRMTEVEHQLIRRVAGMQDSDDTQALLHLFQAGWRAWPPLQLAPEDCEDHPFTPGYRCQLDILSLQDQVDRMHQAVHHGQLGQVQTVVTEELVLVTDHTGLPPLQKAVLFEWLSIVQFLSRQFPHSVNHPDHMGRTALHYAAAYHEYQDNILYKQLLRAGAREDVSDLNGLKPTDFLNDANLFSIDHMREEIACRLSRPPKDYTNHLTYEDSRSSLQAPRSHDANPSIKRWRILASVASFGNNTHRKISNHVPFEETRLYESIITNDVYSVRYWLSQGEDVNQRSMEGWSYLHLAVAYNVSPGLLSLLLTQLSPAERDCDGVTPLELSMTTYKNSTLTTVFLDVITGRILGGDLPPLQALAQDGWQCWPDQDYLDTYLQPHITPHMTQFLSTVSQFLSDVREVHQAAMLHQEVDCSLAYVLDTEAGVTSLDSAGLSLVHICVIFYNIKLLSQLLQTFPFIANIRDSVGRTPLHYAACLNDDDYMYTLLRTAKARDDAEDVLGMRPGDYMMDRQVIVSPTIQEMIRDKVHHPVVLQPPWPTCLLSASMEGCKVSEAIKTSDVNTLDALLADLNTDLTQRDCQGQGFLHQALHTGTDLPIFTVLLDRVDIAIRDLNGNTIMDLIVSGFHPEELKDAVEKRVRELIAGDEKKGEAEADRLLLAGWSHWPLAIQDTGETSTQSDQMLDRLLHLKAKVAAVHTAVHEGRSEELPGLLDHELLATAADQTGLPPLHKAVLFKRWHMVQYLVCKFPSTLTTTDNMGRTALHYAAALTTDGDNMYRTLRQAGADPTATDWMGLTPRDYWLQPQAVYLADTVKRMKALLDTPMAKEEETARPDETTYSEFIGTAHFLNSETPTADQQMPLSGKTISSDSERAPAPTSEDGKYITKYLGQALTLALAEIVQKQPSDPIEYLGQWLYRNHKAINDSGQIQI